MSLRVGSYYDKEVSNAYGNIRTTSVKAGKGLSIIEAKSILTEAKIKFIESFVDNPSGDDKMFYSRHDTFIKGNVKNDPENVEVDEGNLKMFARVNNNGEYTTSILASGKYDVGLFRNVQRFTFYYGAVEGRVKFSNVKNVWSAFWILAYDAPWPQGGEVELMETWNGPNVVDPTGPDTKYTCITNNITGLNLDNTSIDCAKKNYNIPGENFNPCTEFHTYRLEKRYGNIKVFIDGKLAAESSNDNGQVRFEIKDPTWEYVNKDVGFNNSVGWVYDSGYSYVILLTQFLGGDAFIKDELPAATDLPTYAECEYVKFEELSDAPNTQYANRKVPDNNMNAKVHSDAVSRRYCRNA